MNDCVHDWGFLPHGDLVQCRKCYKKVSAVTVYPDYYAPSTDTKPYENYTQFGLDNSAELLRRS